MKRFPLLQILCPRLPVGFLFLGLFLAGCGGHFSGPPGPAGIQLSASSRQLDLGESAVVTATVTDFSGRALPDAVVTWESSDSEVASVVPDGRTARVTPGPKGGNVTITARSGDRMAQIQLTVIGSKPRPISFSQDIQPIFTRSCALPDCHAGPEELAQEGMVLSAGESYRHIVGIPANQVFSGAVNRIEPGQPDQSYLIAKIRGTQQQLGGRGAQMPLNGSLPVEDLAKIVKWVEEGAVNN